ncbi:hypothetical protein [Stenotrophomonas sp. 24(2023)]|uniref:hypothetical protein n=1 Tax=Stenotrophomonas sp. 24(2023) TaxID=3068324 RepID=UPI0027DFF0E3|nr:hypothetical protein [Stenotrophomonas sp. 24(2023)]WMJ69691.1 hypothetical protein Q9R17_00855 [Stenotrophomonas sp. 24(2023)]
MNAITTVVLLSLFAVVPATYVPVTHAQDMAARAAMPAPWRELGIVPGMAYAKARRLLVAAGWQVTRAESAKAAVPDFPEIECGQGHGAVCSAGFHKEGQAIAMMIGTTLAGQPFVQGTY